MTKTCSSASLMLSFKIEIEASCSVFITSSSGSKVMMMTELLKSCRPATITSVLFSTIVYSDSYLN